MVIRIICLLMEVKSISFRFKLDNKNVNFPIQFGLENISNKFDAVKSTEMPLTGNVYDFLVDYNAI